MAPLRRGCGRGLAFKPTNFARADAMSDRPTDIRIRQMSLSDIPAVLELERNLPEVPCMATHYGQAAILTPSDYFFARDGIAAEGTMNQEQMVIADLDLHLLEEQRINGTVLPLNDLIRDAYDRVIHYTDHRSDARLVS